MMKRRNFLEKLALAGGTGVSFGHLPSKAYASRAVLSPLTNDKPLTAIQVTVPSTITTGEEFWIGIRMLTHPFYSKWSPTWQRSRATVNGPFNKSSRGIHYMENVVPEWSSEIEISGDEGFEGISKYSFKEGTGPYENDNRPVRRLNSFHFSTPGFKYIRVKDPLTGITGISNPIQVVDGGPEKKLYWGNLHCHSIFGDGIRLPEEVFAFARDESFLDVFALTDHTETITKAQWTYFKEVTNDFNETGRFVTFNGGEWTSSKFGHRNFIYPGDDGPILRSTDPDQDTPEKLFAIAKANGALVIANHPSSPGYTSEWETGHDPEVERLIEVYSIGGVYEAAYTFGNLPKKRWKEEGVEGYHVLDGLKKGYRFGIIGTGDDHDGRPGDSLHALQDKPEVYKLLRGPGLMGVWANDLSRESVFKALWNRSVFGTTNNRTWLKFSVNGSPMGSEIHTQGDLSIRVEAAGNLIIEQIVLIHEGRILKTNEPNKLQVNWATTERKPDAPTWYYVRVKLADEHIAWSSPIWVTPA